MYPVVSAWSCSAGPSLFADDFRLDMYQNSTRNRRLCVTSGRTYPFIYPLSFSQRPEPCDDCLCFGIPSNLAEIMSISAKSLRYSLSVSSCFPLELSQQDRPYLLMICVWTCTKIQPESMAFRHFSAYVSLYLPLDFLT